MPILLLTAAMGSKAFLCSDFIRYIVRKVLFISQYNNLLAVSKADKWKI